MMRKVLNVVISLAIMIMVLEGASASELNTDMSYEDAWRKTFQAVVLEGFTVSLSDKDIGIIQANGAFNQGSINFSCPKIRGHIESYKLTLSATLRESPEGVAINISATGNVISFVQRRSIVLNDVPKEYSETKCHSTGLIERAILSRITSMN